MPMPLTIGTSRALLGQADAAAAAWLALLKEQATYAWDGVQGLSLAAWVDVVQGVEATAGGSGTTIGTLNGRNTAEFNGSGRYATASFPSALAPFAAVVVCRNDDATLSNRRRVTDGISSEIGERITVDVAPSFIQFWTGNTAFVTSFASNNNAAVIRVQASGTTGIVSRNGLAEQSGTINYATGLTGLQIGQATATFAFGFIGLIAHVSIYHGDRLANAATVAAAAQQYYGIS
jgi:hypothetical protein